MTQNSRVPKTPRILTDEEVAANNAYNAAYNKTNPGPDLLAADTPKHAAWVCLSCGTINHAEGYEMADRECCRCLADGYGTFRPMDAERFMIEGDL